MAGKVCPLCETWHPLDGFYNQSNGKGGRGPSAYCKECSRRKQVGLRDAARGGKPKASLPAAYVFGPQPAPGYKQCAVCRGILPHESFAPHRLGTDGLESRCRKCKKDTAARKSKEQNRRGVLLKYKLTQESFDEMVARQGGRCAIGGCEARHSEEAPLHIDHDHSCCPGAGSCGKCVRGLLCPTHNKVLGYFEKYAGVFDSYLESNLRVLSQDPGGVCEPSEPA